jgi:phosphoglycerate kinase
MFDLPTVDKLNFEGKNVLVRGDFDVESGVNPRADSIREIVRYLQEKNSAKIKVIGHTETEYDLAEELQSEFPGVEFDSNLRKNPGEKENSVEFAESIATGWNVYLNEAFATSHRNHASIVSLPKVIKNHGGGVGVGLRFEREIEHLEKVLDNPKRPLIMVISGIKEDKLPYIEVFSKFADKTLVGGLLPEFREKLMGDGPQMPDEGKIIWADLNPDKEDITIHSIEEFEKDIQLAGTIVVSGPLGKFEDEGHQLGTGRVFKAVAENTQAFKVAGGGDTEVAISLLQLNSGFDWISVGGGAMLEFLAHTTLPGIEALK